ETRLLVAPNGLNDWDEPLPVVPRYPPELAPKVAETPSTVKLLASVLCPATLNCPSEVDDEGATTTPGVNCNSVLKLRPFNGSVSTNWRSITVPTEAVSVLTS